MHALVGVFHRKEDSIEGICDCWTYDYTDYYECIGEGTIQAALDNINEIIFDETDDSWYAEQIKKSAQVSEKEALETYASLNGYQQIDYDNGMLYEMGNPYAVCDYWVEGGRWDGELFDKEGNSGYSFPIDDIDLTHENSVQELYAIARSYLDETYEELEEGENLAKEIEKAKKYAEIYGEEICLTLVDIHM